MRFLAIVVLMFLVQNGDLTVSLDLAAYSLPKKARHLKGYFFVRGQNLKNSAKKIRNGNVTARRAEAVQISKSYVGGPA